MNFTIEQLLELARSTHSAQRASALQKLAALQYNTLSIEQMGQVVLTGRMAMDSDNKTVFTSAINLLAIVLGFEFNDFDLWDARFLMADGK